MNVCVIGTGYVGLVTGTCLAYLGRHVQCVDIDERKIKMLSGGKSPIYEPGLDNLIVRGLEQGNLRFLTDLASSVKDADVIFIAVGTPPLQTGKADLSYVKTVAHEIGRTVDLEKRRIIVNKSTVPIGSGNWVEMLLREGLNDNPAYHERLQRLAAGQEFSTSMTGSALYRHEDLDPENLFLVASNPEFLREGSAITDTFYPDRIVIGASDTFATERLRSLYPWSPWLPRDRSDGDWAVRPEG